MSLRAEFDAAAIGIFNAFGDLIEDVTLTIVGAWNPTTETSATTTEQIRVSISDATKAEGVATRGGGVGKLDIMDGDLNALAITSEVTATPKIDDQLTLNGVDYLVRSVADSHGILWKMGLRRV